MADENGFFDGKLAVLTPEAAEMVRQLLLDEYERGYAAGRASNHVSRLELFGPEGRSLGWTAISSSATETHFESHGYRAVVT